jgi:hypothetical protein
MPIIACSYTICYKASEDLTEAIETEPDTGSKALFLFGIPLRCEQRESRSLSYV